MIFKELEVGIKKHLLDAYPNEGCGVISKSADHSWFIPCDNIADDTKTRFQIKRQYTRNLHDVTLAVVHSHAGGLHCPSAADMRCQIDSGVPWGLAVTGENSCSDLLWFGDQAEIRPLIGRGFCHGVTDCYALIRDWYLLKRGIRLPDFPRDWEWWKTDENLYEKNFSKAGFRKLTNNETPGFSDLCLIKIRSKYINHAAVLIGNETILHHPSGNLANDSTRLSIREPIGRWLKHIQYWIRFDGKRGA